MSNNNSKSNAELDALKAENAKLKQEAEAATTRGVPPQADEAISPAEAKRLAGVERLKEAKAKRDAKRKAQQ